MQRTPIKNIQAAKRKIVEIDPENREAGNDLTGNMNIDDIVKLIKTTIITNLDEKLNNLPTKKDLEDVKNEISSEVNTLRLENKNLKEEMAKIKKENDENKKDIQWLQNQVTSNKLLIRGLASNKEPSVEVQTFFKEKLEISPNVQTVRKIFDRDDKMTVVVELGSYQELVNVLKNTGKLAGSSISVQRDLIPKKQQQKKAFLILKKKILGVNKEHKVVVRDDKLKIKDTWFKWNNENKLVSGNSDGESALTRIYGEPIKSINIKYEDIIQELNPKN